MANLLNQLIQSLEWGYVYPHCWRGLVLAFTVKGICFATRTIVGGDYYFKKKIPKGFPVLKRLAVLASTVGLGNISGVAIAIYMGGPGVLVWMWITAALGTVIKFYSSSLAVMLREKKKMDPRLAAPCITCNLDYPS